MDHWSDPAGHFLQAPTVFKVFVKDLFNDSYQHTEKLPVIPPAKQSEVKASVCWNPDWNPFPHACDCGGDQ